MTQVARSSYSLKIVLVPGRRRIHFLAAVVGPWGEDLWVADTTVCGRDAPRDHGMPWGGLTMRQQCGACRRDDTLLDAFADVPEALRAAEHARFLSAGGAS